MVYLIPKKAALYNVIEDPDIDYLENILQYSSELNVLLTGHYFARWVLSRQNHGRHIPSQCLLDHLSRIHRGDIDSANISSKISTLCLLSKTGRQTSLADPHLFCDSA